MIERARSIARRDHTTNVSFVQGDAQVHPFRRDTYDRAISHFGVMFFDDPVAAFANVATALRPGGDLVFVCPQAMQDVEWFTVPYAAVAGHPPRGDGPALSRMFSLADETVVRHQLETAGFRLVDLVALDTTMRFGADVAAAAEFYADSGPMRSLVDQSTHLTRERAIELLTPALEQYAGPDGVHLPGRHWIVTASRATDAGGGSR
jgi:SAM-dependent methyltransferase